MRIGTNISSLKAQRSLATTSQDLATCLERLSSGMRINRPSDDAAGLAIASSLSTQSRLATQAVRNMNDGISAMNIAEGALRELSSISMRQQELAEQAANGVYSASQRRSMNTEANELVKEFNRIIQTTSFNGTNLLDLSTSSTQIQAGTGSSSADVLSTSLGSGLAQTLGNGDFQAPVSYAAYDSKHTITADVNNDGILDLIGSVDSPLVGSVMLGNGDGTFRNRFNFVQGQTNVSSRHDVVAKDVNGDGKLDLLIANNNAADGSVGVFIGNGDGTFNAQVCYAATVGGMVVGDVNNDGVQDIVFGTGGALYTLLGNNNGTFKAATSQAGAQASSYIAMSDFNGDGIQDIATIASASGIAVFRGVGDGTFAKAVTYGGGGYTDIQVADFNNDGVIHGLRDVGFIKLMIGFRKTNTYW